MKSGVWIVIPAYNEEKYIGKVLKECKLYAKNIVVVDDGSTDNTAAIAEKEGVKVLKHVINIGKGACLKTGCDYAFRKGAGFVITMDADLQHRPKDIPRFVRELKNTDIVFGYRQLSKKMPSVLRLGNCFINKMTKFLYGVDLKDTQSGFRAFTAKAYKKIRWKSRDYSMESEMITNAGKYGLRYKEIPIKTLYPDKYKGTTVLDGVKIVWNLIWWKLSKNGQ